MRLMLPKCPHCGKQVNWFRALALKTQGEYRCGKCGECSNVALDKALYSLAAVAAIAGAVFFVLFVTLVQEFSFTSLVLIAVPFLLFFLISPFFCPPAAYPAGKGAAGCAGEGAPQAGSGTDARYAARGPAAEPGARPDGQGRTQRRGIRAPSESADGPAVIAPFEHRGRFFETGWECAGKSGGLPDLGGQRAGKTRARCGRRQGRSRSLYVCYWGNHVTWI